MAWATPHYSRRQVDKAGGFLTTPADDPDVAWWDEWEHALAVINNWRSSHSYSLQAMKMTLLNRARNVHPDALVAQRLKRLSSIVLKLRHNEHMKLSQMQDIGGCRAVLRDVRQVAELVELYVQSVAKNPKKRAELIEPYDYITAPKPDGYRSYHLVFKYRSTAERHRVYNGLRIEIQIRSRLQHAWATAVETVSTFTGQALKSNIGDEDWKRFFRLMGTAIARWENTPLIPDTPTTKRGLRDELLSLCAKLKVDDVLMGWRTALQIIEPREKATAYLLMLDTDRKRIEIVPYDYDEMAEAHERYLEIEKETRDDPAIQAVLVSVDSIAALRTAYPNYYLDTTAFLRAVKTASSSESTARSRRRLKA